MRVRYAVLDDEVPALVLPNKDALANTLMGGIKSVWNVFKAGRGAADDQAPTAVDIEFKPEVATPRM